MRWDRFLLVLALIGTAATMATKASPGAAARARQSFESGVSLEHSGQYKQAIAALTQAIRSHALEREDMARALFDRGLAYDAMGDLPRALEDYSEALRVMPRLSAALSNRGNVFRRQGRLESAKKDYLAALRCPGVSGQYPYYGLGLIAEQLGDRDTARNYFQMALAVDPSFALAAQSLMALSARQSPSGHTALSHTSDVLSLRAPARPVPSAVRAVPQAKQDNSPSLLVAAKPPQPSRQSEPAAAIEGHPRLRLATNDSGDRAGTRTGVQVQLGAFRDQQTALEAWNRIAAASANLLDGLQPIVLVADIPGRGRFWRLRTDVSDSQAGRKLCTALAKRGQACLLARN